MLTHPTIELLHGLGLHGMAKGFRALEQTPEARSLEHAEWLGLLLEHEATLRQQNRFDARIKAARMRYQARIEDVNYRAPRGLDRALFLKLTSNDWIRKHRNCLIVGPVSAKAGIGTPHKFVGHIDAPEPRDERAPLYGVSSGWLHDAVNATATRLEPYRQRTETTPTRNRDHTDKEPRP